MVDILTPAERIEQQEQSGIDPFNPQQMIAQQQAIQTPTPAPAPAPTPAAPADGDIFSAPEREYVADIARKKQLLAQQVGEEEANRLMGTYGGDILKKRTELKTWGDKERAKRLAKGAPGLSEGTRTAIGKKLATGMETLNTMGLAEELFDPRFLSHGARVGSFLTNEVRKLAPEWGAEAAEWAENKVGEMFGTDYGYMPTFAGKYDAWRSAVQMGAQKFRHDITGAQSGFREMEYLLNIMPTESDGPGRFQAKWAAIKQIQEAQNQVRQQLLTEGIDVGGAGLSPEQKSRVAIVKQQSGVNDLATSYAAQFGEKEEPKVDKSKWEQMSDEELEAFVSGKP